VQYIEVQLKSLQAGMVEHVFPHVSFNLAVILDPSYDDLIIHHQELIEKVSKNELSKEDYPCLNDPSPSFHGTPYAGSVTQNPPAHSIRSRRTPTWARPRGSDDGYSRFYFPFLYKSL
jgi:hypothetical protein